MHSMRRFKHIFSFSSRHFAMLSILFILSVLLSSYVLAQFGGTFGGTFGGFTFLDSDPSCESLCNLETFPSGGFGCGASFGGGQPITCNCGGGEYRGCPSGTYCWPDYWWCAATEEEAARQTCEEREGGYWQESIQECYECEDNSHCSSPEVCAYDPDTNIKVCGTCDYSSNHCSVCGWKWLNVPNTPAYGCFQPCSTNDDCTGDRSCAFLGSDKVCASPSTSDAHCQAAGGTWSPTATGGECKFSCDAVGWTSACGCASATECKDTSFLGTCTLGGSTPCPEGWYCMEDNEGNGQCQPPSAGQGYCELAGMHWDSSSNACCEAENYHWEENMQRCCELAGGEWDDSGYWDESNCLFQRNIEFCIANPDKGSRELYNKSSLVFASLKIKAPNEAVINDVQLEQKIRDAINNNDEEIFSYIISLDRFNPQDPGGNTIEDFCISDAPQWFVDSGLKDAMPSGADIVELTCSSEIFEGRECQWNAGCSDGACIIPEGKCIDNKDCNENEICINGQCIVHQEGECTSYGSVILAKVGEEIVNLADVFGEETPKVLEGTPLLFAVTGSEACSPESAELLIDGSSAGNLEANRDILEGTEYGTMSVNYAVWSASGDGVHAGAKITLQGLEPVNVGDVIVCAEGSSLPECGGNVYEIGCGDMICAGDETPSTCPEDCGGGESATIGEEEGYEGVQNETFPAFTYSNVAAVLILLIGYYAYTGRKP